MLKIAYIQDETPAPKKKRVSAKQEFHERMVAEVANQRIIDREKAKIMFAEEYAEIEELTKQLNSL